MNLNLFRTIFGVLTGSGLLLLVVKLLGCEIDDPATAAIEATTCEGSTILSSISPFATALGTFVLLAIGGVAKMFKSGTVVQNLTAPSVPVVASADAKVGVVTPAQVNTPGTGK